MTDTGTIHVDDRVRYSTVEVAELAGLSYREVDYWCRTGAIWPYVEADGSGSRRQWTSQQASWLQSIAAVRRAALDRGLLMNVVAIADVWSTLARGDAWTLTLP